VITLEGWYNLMVLLMDAYNKYIVIIFFILVIKICHYLLINLTLAVMVNNLQRHKVKQFTDLINRKQDLLMAIDER
jgi:hypothetical protein